MIKKFWDYLKDKNNWKMSAGNAIGGIIGGIIGAVIGGPLGLAIGSYLGSKAGGAIESSIQKHANGTFYHSGGPALINDQLGPTYQELVRLPSGLSFIPSARNVLIPDLPRGSSVLNATETKKLLPHYAEGVGSLLARPNLDQSNRPGNGNGLDTDRIVDRLDNLESAIRNLNIRMYADNREIARSSNDGNRLLDRRQHSIAST